MRVNFLITMFMVKVNINMLTEELMKVNGKIIKWMDKEFLNG